jgi:hypothetical protein
LCGTPFSLAQQSDHSSGLYGGDLPIRAILYAKRSPAERRAEQEEDCGIALSHQL